VENALCKVGLEVTFATVEPGMVYRLEVGDRLMVAKRPTALRQPRLCSKEEG